VVNKEALKARKDCVCKSLFVLLTLLTEEVKNDGQLYMNGGLQSPSS